MQVITENKVVPKLRFAEFENKSETNSYKKHSFTDVFLFSSGKNIKQNEASPEFETPCVRYGELYHMYNEVIYEIINRTNLEKSELLFSQGDEILLPSAGEDPLDICSASAITIKDVAIGRTINVLRPKSDDVYSQKYASYYINQKLRKQISRLAKGVSISNVYNSDLKKLKIILPSLKEQRKVDSFLSAVDDKLQQLKKKKELLEEYKKGVMQKIFSQELRFKDKFGNNYPDWEKKKLGEVCSITTGKKDVNQGNKNGLFPFFTCAKNHTYSDSYSYDFEAILIAGNGEVGFSQYFNGKFEAYQRTYILFDFTVSAIYLLKYLNFFLDRTVKKQKQMGAMPYMKLGTLTNFTVLIQSKEEEQKIANFLSSLDAKIDFVNTQIENTKAFKKGLLQQMFV